MPRPNLFDLLVRVVPLEALEARGSLKLQAKGFQDLCLDFLGRRRGHRVISLAHYVEMGNDLVCDPDMEVEIDAQARSVRPLAIQMALGTYSRAVTWDAQGVEHVNRRVLRDLQSFLRMWLTNIIASNYVLHEEPTSEVLLPGDNPQPGERP